MILGLSYMSYGNFKRFGQSLTEVSLPEIEMPETNFEEILTPSGESEQEWVSPSGRLKLTHSTSWTETTPSSLGYFDQADIVLGETDLLLFAYQFDLDKQAFALLTVNKSTDQETLEEIMEEIRKNIEEQNGKIEIEISEADSGVSWLEMVWEYPNQPNFYSKGKAFFGAEKIYLVVFTTFQSDWSKFEQEAQEIFDSTQLIL
jgi:hypothetical protein